MLLITRPNHDNATNYLFYWSSLIKDYALKEKLVKVLLKGKSVEEADNRSKKMLLNNLRKILSSSSSDKEDTARWSYHDYCSQVLIGNKEAVAI